MRKSLQLLIVMLISLTGKSQDFSKAEYFFDNDPGIGNGNSITLSSTADPMTFTTNISTAALTPGFHFLAIRVKENSGPWSLFESRGFYISLTTGNASDIIEAEYFFDSDPGLGNGIDIPVVGGATTNFTVSLPTTALLPGFHFLAIRTKGSDGKWGVFESRGFYISESTTNAANIVEAEYFFDIDPGQGNGINIPVSAGATTNFTVSLPTTPLSPGFHFLAIRTKGTDGKWGVFESRGFYVSSQTTDIGSIIAAEYFFDTDPGTGNGTAIPITSGANTNFTVSLPATGLTAGFHFLAIRTKGSDDKWGVFESRGFYVSSQTTDTGSIIAAEYFFDTDPGEGNGTPLTVNTPGAVVNQTFTIPITTGLPAGTHTLSIRVQASNGKWSFQETGSFNVLSNQLPVANAGSDQTINLPVNNAALDGTLSSDPDGTISTYTWTKISGPAGGSINNPSQSIASAENLIGGTYSFELIVTDNNGTIDRDTVLVNVISLPNQPPVANAGTNQTITLPTSSVTLNGSTSSDTDGTISTFSWTKINGPASGTITNASQAISTANSLTQGVYEFELIVTDNEGATDKDTVQITVNPAPNVPPSAIAGIDQSITLPTDSATLNGSSSSDTDGTITTFDWTKISGPSSGTINNSSQSIATANSLAQGIYKFELIVTDNNGASGKDTVQVTVNAAPNVVPVANAGMDQVITLPTTSTTLNGSASVDSDGTISSYSWIKISGPSGTIINGSQSIASANSLLPGVYKFELTVTDNNSATDKDTVQIIVNAAPNQPPDANAGSDQFITLPINSTTLNGSASADPDGTIITYSWTKINGPTSGTLSNANQSNATANNLTAGIYQFELTVNDNNAAIDKDTVQVTVNAAPNQPPVANAGSDQFLTLPINSTTLNSSGSADPDGTITLFSWSKISGPASGGISNADQQSTLVTNLAAGLYQFELTVTDNSAATDKDTVNVTVDPGCPSVPTITQLDNLLVCNPAGASYQWYQEGSAVEGAITQVFEINLNEHGLYAVEITANGCTKRSADFVYLITDEENDIKGFQLYPNPFTNKIVVMAPAHFNGTTITIMDALGRKLIDSRLSSGVNEIKTDDLSRGSYYVFIGEKFWYKIQKI